MEKEKLVEIKWDAERDQYWIYVAGRELPIAGLYISHLEDLQDEINRVLKEVSA